MNRRDFNKSLGALLAAPALPFKALMAPHSAAAASVIPPPNLYTWGAAIARTHGRVSSDMLSTMLHVDASQAASLFDKLIGNNVVGPANAVGFGQAKAILPNPSGLAGATVRVAPKSDTSLVRDQVKALLDDLVEDSPEDDATPPPADSKGS